MTTENRWQAVLARDARFDGAFVYAVESTGIYCRPSCPSRRPGRRHVSFYALPEAAEQAGFRACLRCRPQLLPAADPQIDMVRKACRFIEDYEGEDGLGGAPTLGELGSALGLSPHHLQRTFKRHLGVSPKAYADAHRIGRAKAGLREGNGVADAAYGAGFGSTSRLYERADDRLGMTPATYARGGKNAQISFGITESALGRLLVAATERGVCAVYLGDDDDVLADELRIEYPLAEIVRDEGRVGEWAGRIVAHLGGEVPDLRLPLDLRATAFQWRVWNELVRIPIGETRTYSEIATRLGTPKGQRAVGRACATNPVSIVVPCHRAVREDGGLGGYRWGVGRKERLIAGERTRAAK